MFFRFPGNRPAAPQLICVAALLTIVGGVSCSRQPQQRGAVRLAILRFENLSGDASADWIGRAIPEMIRTGLTPDRDIYAVPGQRLHAANAAFGSRNFAAPGVSSERALAMALRADRLGYGEYYLAQGRLHARLTMEDAITGEMTAVMVASAAGDDVFAIAESLARQISGRAGPIQARSNEALRLYSQGLESPDRAQTEQLLERAIAAGPDFGPPYRALAEVKTGLRDSAGAVRVLETALARGAALGDSERARAESSLAALRNDSAGRRRAAAALTNLEPQDPANWQLLADVAMSQADFTGAAQAYRKLTGIEPSDTNAWNQLGYAACYAGDLPGALRALERYRSLRPGDPNASDSMGDVNLIHLRYAEAEKLYLENARKNPAFLNGADFLKAAMARLMTGDASGATALANEYAEARGKAQDPLVGLYRAEWSWLSGRRQAACTEMEQFARSLENGPNKEIASRAYAELAIWRLMLGEREAARQGAAKAAAQSGPSTAAMAGLAAFLSQPPASAEEWGVRASRAFPGAPPGSLKEAVLAYSLLLEKDFRAAAEALGRYNGISLVSSDPVPLLALAWARFESGQVNQAAPALRWNPVIAPTGPGVFVAFYFPRIYYLRGALAQQQGKTDEARAYYRTFLQLSGPDPLQWGEEAKAKAAL